MLGGGAFRFAEFYLTAPDHSGGRVCEACPENISPHARLNGGSSGCGPPKNGLRFQKIKDDAEGGIDLCVRGTVGRHKVEDISQWPDKDSPFACEGGEFPA